MEDVSIIYDRIITRALNTPGVRINRINFLEKNLGPYCSREQIANAITTSVKNAGISGSLLDIIATKVVRDQTLKVTGISVLSGMPGGLAMVATIPADLAQFYYNVIVLAQKLAFLYGYPQFDEEDDVDDELVYHLTLFIGVMYGVREAETAVSAFSQNLAADLDKKVPEKVLTETAYYMLKKNTARWIGIKATEKTLSRGIGKVIPIVSGFISGGVAYTTFRPMAQRLKDALEEGYMG